MAHRVDRYIDLTVLEEIRRGVLPPDSEEEWERQIAETERCVRIVADIVASLGMSPWPARR